MIQVCQKEGGAAFGQPESAWYEKRWSFPSGNLANRLGVSRDVISNLEYGRVQPKELVIKHICDLYGVNEQWIKDGNGPMFSSPPRNNKKLEEAVSIFQSLRPEFQDFALQQIRQLAELQKKTEGLDL